MGDLDAMHLESSTAPSEMAGYSELSRSSVSLSSIDSTTSRQEVQVLPGSELGHGQFHKEDGSELPKEQLVTEKLSSQSDEELPQSEPLLSKDSPEMSLNSNDLSLEGHPSGSWMEGQENQCEDEMKTLHQPSQKKCNDAGNKYLPSSPMQPNPASGDCNGKSSTECAQPLDISAKLSRTLEVSEHTAVLTSVENVEEKKTGENDLILPVQCSEEFPENDELIEHTDSKVYIASTPFCHLDLELGHGQFYKEDGSELPKEQLDTVNPSSQSDEDLSQSKPLLSKDSPEMSLNSNDLSLEGHPSGSWIESQENLCEDGTVDQEPQDFGLPHIPQLCTEKNPKLDEMVENCDPQIPVAGKGLFVLGEMVPPTQESMEGGHDENKEK